MRQIFCKDKAKRNEEQRWQSESVQRQNEEAKGSAHCSSVKQAHQEGEKMKNMMPQSEGRAVILNQQVLHVGTAVADTLHVSCLFTWTYGN